MTAAVRSLQLFALRPPAGQAINGYICPAGMTTIVKSVIVQSHNTASSTVACAAISAGADNPNVSLVTGDLAANSSDTWEGWLVLSPGDFVNAYASAGLVDFWVSGAELPGVAQPITTSG